MGGRCLGERFGAGDLLGAQQAGNCRWVAGCFWATNKPSGDSEGIPGVVWELEHHQHHSDHLDSSRVGPSPAGSPQWFCSRGQSWQPARSHQSPSLCFPDQLPFSTPLSPGLRGCSGSEVDFSGSMEWQEGDFDLQVGPRRERGLGDSGQGQAVQEVDGRMGSGALGASWDLNLEPFFLP